MKKQIGLFDDNKDYIENFINAKIEDVFAERFASYSKYIIQDRALPDIRDGLKPVQRRILFAMHRDGNTYNKQYRKSAKTVGNVIGNYHPHGDTSVYEAMVRMSQNWKVNKQLIIMHGNNGSIDGDSAAAMRYTEAKLSEYSESLLKDIDMKTVNMIPNFDDTEFEPTVLPTRIPNLLINGVSGISSGYATDIPPHNTSEVLKAAIYVNDNYESVTLSNIMKYIKGPDFPTGAIIQGKEEIKKAYETGKGKIVVKSKIEIVKNDIVVKEIPYDVNKANLLQKIELIKIDKKIDGISEIIDQSAQDFIEIIIKCQKDANPEMILSYLLKNTDLQKNYNFNMIAINNKRPEQLTLVNILKAFISHREDVVIRRSKFELERVKTRLHLTEGIKLAIENLDKVIKIIRSSNDKKDAIENLIKEFSFSKIQAEAVVNMQLYRLTNTDINFLIEEINNLIKRKEELEEILNNKSRLKELIKEELEEELSLFKEKRKSQIEDEIEKIEISKVDLIKSEDVIVTISKNGYIKRTTTRSYAATDMHVEYNESDYLVKVQKVNTKDRIYVILNDGTYVIIPVYEIADMKWKEVGKHLSMIAKINDGASVINFFTEKEMESNNFITISQEGYYNKINGMEFIVSKEKNKIIFQKIKNEDRVKCFIKADKEHVVFEFTNDEYLLIKNNDIEVQNIKRLGKKIIRYKKNQEINLCGSFDQYVTFITDKSGFIKLHYLEMKSDGKTHRLFENIKSNKHEVIKVCETGEHVINLSSDNVLVNVDKLEECYIEDKLKVIKRNLKIKDISEKINL